MPCPACSPVASEQVVRRGGWIAKGAHTELHWPSMFALSPQALSSCVPTCRGGPRVHAQDDGGLLDGDAGLCDVQVGRLVSSVGPQPLPATAASTEQQAPHPAAGVGQHAPRGCRWPTPSPQALANGWRKPQPRSALMPATHPISRPPSLAPAATPRSRRCGSRCSRGSSA